MIFGILQLGLTWDVNVYPIDSFWTVMDTDIFETTGTLGNY